ncbi:MAG TPA: hypothetical protein VM122_11000, partial [Usitatibacter sp.]|nr:hypothetical protein [Usitatibacter sp.]
MIASRSPRAVSLSIAAAALLGLLIFLFVRTQSVDIKSETHALSLLRDMKDQDARWDIDALRLANDLAAAAPSGVVPDRDRHVARSLQDLERGSGAQAIAPTLPALKAALAEKAAAFGDLRLAHRRSVESLASFNAQADLLTTRANAAKSRGAAAVAAMLAELDHVRAAFRGTAIEEQPSQLASVTPRIALVRPAAVAADPFLGEAAAALESTARAFVQARTAEGAAWRRFAFLTFGGRLELTVQEVGRSIATALDEKDRWRVYLAAYAGALLIGVGYLGMRVINAQRELRLANEQLERRVAERTAELTQAMGRLKESEAQLVQTEKMSSLGQLVAGVAHEINTPLAYVKNSVASVRDRMPQLREAIEQSEALLAMLHSESPDPEVLQAAFALLSAKLGALSEHQVLYDLDALTKDGLHGIEQISELVNNLRNFARLDRSKVASYNVNDSVRSTFLIAR